MRRVLFFGGESNFSKICHQRLLDLLQTQTIELQHCSNLLTQPLSKFSLPQPQFFLGVIASYAHYIPHSLINQFKTKTCLNAHPSIIPDLRGPAPIHRALMRGDRKLGITVIDCEISGYDRGYIWAQEQFEILDEEAWYDKIEYQMAMRAASMLAHIIIRDEADFEKLKANRKPQPVDGECQFVEYAHKISLSDALVDFHSMTAKEIWNRYRALVGYEKLFIHLFDKELIFLDMQLIDRNMIKVIKKEECLIEGLCFYLANTHQESLPLLCVETLEQSCLQQSLPHFIIGTSKMIIRGRSTKFSPPDIFQWIWQRTKSTENTNKTRLGENKSL